MKLLHTSDWHLGRTLHQVDLTAEHRAYLEHLLAVVAAEKVDAVLVSGDIYDRAYPPVTSVALLHQALAELTKLTHVVLTAGNHDSAQRLGFLEGLTKERLHLRTRPRSGLSPISIPTAAGTLAIFAFPYLDVDTARREFPASDGTLPARSHEAVMQAVIAELTPEIARLRAAGPGATVVAAHAFVAGGKPTESERDIQVGGVDLIPSGVFAPLAADYLALGHLHRPQKISGPIPTRYAGSPIAFSFSEAGQEKSTTLVEFFPAEPQKPPEIRLIPAPVSHPLVQLQGNLTELLARQDIPDCARVKVTLTDPIRPPGAYQKLKEKYPNLLVLAHIGTADPERPAALTTQQLTDPLAVVATFLAHVTQQEVPQIQRDLIRNAYRAVLAAELEV